MTAIFLAAMIFIVEAVQRREGVDDPLYELFLSKSWARWTFAIAVWLLIGTAFIYVLGPIAHLVSEFADARGDVLGVSSLVVAAALALIFLLRALHVLRPEQYREFRRDAVIAQVRRGARSQVRSRSQASRSIEDLMRQLRGNLNDPETQAVRAIERVMDQAHQAVERAQLTEIRENMDLLERVCETIADERENGKVGIPELSSSDDQRWLGYVHMLLGMQRMVRTAADSSASDFILWAIFLADVQKDRAGWSTPFRLVENIDSGNELFVQVMLDCMQLEQTAFTKLTDASKSFRFQTPQEEMLSVSLRSALSSLDEIAQGSRRHRIALRMAKFVLELAGSAALKGEKEQACAYLESFLRQAEDVVPSDVEESVSDDPLRSAMRRAVLMSIGYGVGIRNFEFIEVAKRSTSVGKLIEAGQIHHLPFPLEQDSSERSDGERVLGFGPLWLTRGMKPGRLVLETESDVQRAEAECVLTGYMWLLGIIHDGRSDPELPDSVRSELDRVWGVHGASLVAALGHAGLGERWDLWSWCEAAFTMRDEDSSRDD